MLALSRSLLIESFAPQENKGMPKKKNISSTLSQQKSILKLQPECDTFCPHASLKKAV